MKKIAPYLIILSLCLITFNLWLFSKSDYSIFRESPARAVSQMIALLGIVLMSVSLLMSTRLKAVENLFGGLDQVYIVHHIMGSMSFVFLVHHPLLLALQTIPNYKATLVYLLPSADLAYTAGVVALYTMIFSFIFMVFIKLPYHIWKITHRFLGVTFLFGSIHALLITSDISVSLPLKLWMMFFITLGLLSALYIIFLYHKLGPHLSYAVNTVKRVLDIVDIYLVPTGQKTLTFIPGQFVYARFDSKAISAEMHPFSISSAPHDEVLRLSAKILGDYTLKLPYLSPGNQVTLYGPYGKFHHPQDRNAGNILWIAGGIGVTPFLSLLRSEREKPTHRSVHFYYIYRNHEEGVYLDEIFRTADNLSHITIINWCSQEMGRFKADIVANHLNLSIIDYILICGPTVMMESLKKQFMHRGIDEEKILFENFSLL